VSTAILLGDGISIWEDVIGCCKKEKEGVGVEARLLAREACFRKSSERTPDRHLPWSNDS
jgi:hypothetical protein